MTTTRRTPRRTLRRPTTRIVEHHYQVTLDGTSLVGLDGADLQDAAYQYARNYYGTDIYFDLTRTDARPHPDTPTRVAVTFRFLGLTESRSS